MQPYLNLKEETNKQKKYIETKIIYERKIYIPNNNYKHPFQIQYHIELNMRSAC